MRRTDLIGRAKKEKMNRDCDDDVRRRVLSIFRRLTERHPRTRYRIFKTALVSASTKICCPTKRICEQQTLTMTNVSTTVKIIVSIVVVTPTRFSSSNKVGRTTADRT